MQRNQMGIESANEHQIAQQCNAAVDLAATNSQIVRQRTAVLPEWLPVRVSSAVTLLGASEIYITPSTTKGVVSNFCSEFA